MSIASSIATVPIVRCHRLADVAVHDDHALEWSGGRDDAGRVALAGVGRIDADDGAHQAGRQRRQPPEIQPFPANHIALGARRDALEFGPPCPFADCPAVVGEVVAVRPTAETIGSPAARPSESGTTPCSPSAGMFV